jgi:cytosolic carboxypeptidase protein 2/3
MISSNRSSRILLNKRRFDNSIYKFFLRLPDENEMKVRFESRFENGNLKKAIKVSDTEYNLLLNFDYNTRGHTQWFYFKVMTKLPAGTTLQFRILNLMKPDSLYNCGMKPWVLSESHRSATGEEWHRDGDNVSYKVNDIIRNRQKIPADVDKQTFK